LSMKDLALAVRKDLFSVMYITECLLPPGYPLLRFRRPINK